MTSVARSVRAFEVTRKPEHEGYDSLHGSKQYAPDDFLILVDGEVIGGTYLGNGSNPARTVGWGHDDGNGNGDWISWGPRGLSCGHPTREAAEMAQAREYATNPDLYDRQTAMDRAEKAAELARQEAEQNAARERREAERRRERLGDDEPGPVIWTLPAYHVVYADPDEVSAVADWTEANGIADLDVRHEVRVEQRATRRVAVYEKPAWVHNGCSTDRTETYAVTITTDPPPVIALPRPDLHCLIAEHWAARFPLIDYGQTIACGKCTREARAVREDEMVAFPCPVLAKAIANEPTVAAAHTPEGT